MPRPHSSLTRRSLLGAGTAALLAPGLGAIPRASRRNLILVFAEGGWDTCYSLDPKLDVPQIVSPGIDATPHPDDVDQIEWFGELPIVVNPIRRPAVGAFFAEHGHRITLVNGAWSGAVGHPLARRRLLTGTESGRNPDLTVIYGVEAGSELPIGAFSFSRWQHRGTLSASTARTGSTDQLDVLLYPSDGVDELAEPDALTELRLRRIARFRERWGDGGPNDTRLDAELESIERAAGLRALARGDALTLAKPPTLADSAPQAVDLLRAGATRSILLAQEGFDTHSNTHHQDSLQQDLFTGVHALAQHLEAAGLLDDTLVMVTSEMTRTPALNSMGGKDHWPYLSFLFFGGGAPANRLLGGTDDRMEGRPVDLATGALWDGGALPRYDQILAGVLEHLDVDPGPWWPQTSSWGGLLR
ncbi:MAG TPA: DUF1501 domain-containing protein [Deltaproteobacteria bacterium]|nr:DUF1501 domain-containing protein [Deltaproteobacteria bacterium]